MQASPTSLATSPGKSRALIIGVVSSDKFPNDSGGTLCIASATVFPSAVVQPWDWDRNRGYSTPRHGGRQTQANDERVKS